MAGHWKILDLVAIGLATATPYFFVLVVVTLHFLSLSSPRWQKYWKTTVGAGIGAVVGVTLSKFISLLFPESRPFVEGEGHQLLSHSPDNSFPSDHTTFLVAVALPFLLDRNWKVGTTLFGLALLGGVARIFVGVHWPVDILGGIVIGIIGGSIGWQILEGNNRWIKLQKIEKRVLNQFKKEKEW